MVIKTMKTYIKEILDKRKNIPRREYTVFSEQICQKLLNLKEYYEAENVLVFYPYLGEVDILPFVLKAFSDKKNVYFPKVTGETTMEFIKVNSLDDFAEGYKGIKEPKGDMCFDRGNADVKTCMIAPGSAFDKYGNRCGYGKGYYDRYLEKCYKNITKIGVCFSIQMMDEMSDVKKTDIPMDYIINENETIGSAR